MLHLTFVVFANQISLFDLVILTYYIFTYLYYTRATSSVEAFLDSSDVTKEDFILHSMFINKVNGIFASHKFHSTVGQQHPSRPGLAHVHLPLECHQQILNILFDKDGSLRNEIVEDIDLSRENDPRYIDFGNTAENGRNDRRFQVGIKKQILGKSKIPFVATSRNLNQ